MCFTLLIHFIFFFNFIRITAKKRGLILGVQLHKSSILLTGFIDEVFVYNSSLFRILYVRHECDRLIKIIINLKKQMNKINHRNGSSGYFHRHEMNQNGGQQKLKSIFSLINVISKLKSDRYTHTTYTLTNFS